MIKVPTRLILSITLVVTLSGCVAGTRLTPVTDSNVRLQFNGVSIQPPPGNDWYRVWLAQPKGVVVLFHKKLPDFPTRGHTFAAGVNIWDLGEHRFANAAELGARFDQLFREAHKGGTRHKFLDSTYEVDATMGSMCARIYQAQEDIDVPGWRGATFVINAHAIRCVHPNSARYVVDVHYSERRLKSDPPVSLQSEVEPFLKSLEFSPLR